MDEGFVATVVSVAAFVRASLSFSFCMLLRTCYVHEVEREEGEGGEEVKVRRPTVGAGRPLAARHLPATLPDRPRRPRTTGEEIF